jgi:hypothetical protein
VRHLIGCAPIRFRKIEQMPAVFVVAGALRFVSELGRAFAVVAGAVGGGKTLIANARRITAGDDCPGAQSLGSLTITATANSHSERRDCLLQQSDASGKTF